MILQPISMYPQLQLLCWNRHDKLISDSDALRLYETRWRFIDERLFEPLERAYLLRLIAESGTPALSGTA